MLAMLTQRQKLKLLVERYRSEVADKTAKTRVAELLGIGRTKFSRVINGHEDIKHSDHVA